MSRLISLFILMVSFKAFTQSYQPDIAERLDSFMTGQFRYFGFNGNILIATKGTILFKKSFGYRNFETRELLNDSSVFELASLTKQFTALAVLQLKEKGLLSLEDDIRKHFPDFPYSGISIKNLLTHSSGLPEYYPLIEGKWDVHKVVHNTDIYRLLIAKHPVVYFPAGQKWEYSNTGYVILALLIEKLSGLSFDQFLAVHIFNPLGMHNTFVLNNRRFSGRIISNFAFGYMYSDKLHRYVLADQLDGMDFLYYMEGIIGDGGIVSTTTDLLKWDESLYQGRLVSRKSMEEFGYSWISTGTGTNHYGFGVFVNRIEGKGRIEYHSGGWPGYRTYLGRFTDSVKTVIILSNNFSSSGILAKSVESILYGGEIVMPYMHKATIADTNKLHRYEGQFSSDKDTLTIKMVNTKVYLQINNQSPIEIIPESDTRLFYADRTDNYVSFERSGSGSFDEGDMISYGIKIPFKRFFKQ